MKYTKSWFTLFELMVVIALLGIFFYMIGFMTNNTGTHQTRAERLATGIFDMMRSARNNMIIGRGVFSGWVVAGSGLVVTSRREVVATKTGVLTKYWYNITGTGIESSLVSPYYDNDPVYTITDLAISSGGIIPGAMTWDKTGSTVSSISVIFLTNNQIEMTGTVVPAYSGPIRTIKITAWYGEFEQSILVDRITGTIEQRKSGED